MRAPNDDQKLTRVYLDKFHNDYVTSLNNALETQIKDKMKDNHSVTDYYMNCLTDHLNSSLLNLFYNIYITFLMPIGLSPGLNSPRIVYWFNNDHLAQDEFGKWYYES